MDAFGVDGVTLCRDDSDCVVVAEVRSGMITFFIPSSRIPRQHSPLCQPISFSHEGLSTGLPSHLYRVLLPLCISSSSSCTYPRPASRFRFTGCITILPIPMTAMTANGHANGNGHLNGSTPSPLYTVPPGHLLLHLSSGGTTAFRLSSYPAASFYLYIPSSHPVSQRKRGESSTALPRSRTNGHASNGKGNGHAMNGNGHGEERQFPLVVCIHGSHRDAEGLRDRWADLAEREGFVVLAPLFPVDMDVSTQRTGFYFVGITDRL